MAHSEVVLSSSPAQLALLDLQSGRTLINYKSAESSSSASSASALDTSTRLVGQPRKLTTCVLGQNGLGGAVATYGGPGKGSIRYGTFASVSSRLASKMHKGFELIDFCTALRSNCWL